jgi:fucose 4-O-acetylase-like acetyltransferase
MPIMTLANLSTRLSETLEPIAAWFRSLGTPEPIVHWGHPLMMGIVVVVLGSYVGLAGWRGRLVGDKDAAIKSRLDHRKLAPLMFLFIALGYTGGVLSLVMQQKPILESPHFITGTIALILLATNGAIAATAFAQEKGLFRNIHAYLGSAALGLLFLHGLLGLKLGLSI